MKKQKQQKEKEKLKCKFCKGIKFRKYKEYQICQRCRAKVKSSNGFNLWSKSLVIVLSFVLLASLIYALQITEISTPTGTTQNDSVVIEYNFTFEGDADDNLTSLNWSWDGTDYNLYDDSLVLFYNFDNRSELGENDTYVKDLSMYGNDGLVVGDENISWTDEGKYGGAFNFSGNVSSINVNNLPSYNITNQVTFSFWLYLNNYKTSTYMILEGRSGSYRSAGLDIETTGKLRFNILNGSYETGDDTDYRKSITSPSIIPLDEWIFISATYSNTTGDLILYYNEDTLVSTNVYEGMEIFDSGSTFGLGSTGSGFSLMKIDDFMYFNRALSANEVNQLYRSQVTKYDTQNYTFYTNQSLGSYVNSTLLTYDFDYKLCSSNVSTEVCLSDRTITKEVVNSVIVSNYSSLIGNINNNFYGAVVRDYLVQGTDEVNAWHESSLLDIPLSYNREDMSLSSTSKYYGVTNWGMEDWYNLSKVINSSEEADLCYAVLGGWGCTAWQYDETNEVNISRSLESHSGTYSLMSNGTGGISTANGIFGYLYLSPATYNFTFWINTTGIVSFSVRNQIDLTYPCSTASTGSGNWELVNCSFTITENNTLHKILIEDWGPTQFLVDDFEFLKDGEPFYFTQGNLTIDKKDVEWTYNHANQKYMMIGGYTPYFLANASSLCSEADDGRSIYSRCPILNLSIYGDMLIDYINYTTNYGEWVDVVEVENWNEPYGGGFFLPGGNMGDRMYYQNEIYNYSQNIVKTNFPTIEFGGPSGYLGTTERDAFVEDWIQNFTGYYDYLSLHTYGQDQYENDIALTMETDMNKLLGYCTTYSADCSRIIWSEWGNWNHTLKNTTEYEHDYNKLIADTYRYTLNNFAENVTMVAYQWSDGSSTTEPRWGMVDYNTLNYRPMYNVTKNFAHLCPAGGQVYESLSDDATIKVVSCKDGNQYSNIIINTGDESRNVTLDGTTATDKAYMMDINTGDLYLTNNSNQLGIMDSYDIKYLGTPNFTLTIANNLTKTAKTGEIYTSNNEAWFASRVSSVDKTTYHLANVLSIPTTVQVSVPADCSYTKRIDYISSGGTYNQIFRTGDFACSENVATMNLTLEYSTSSNQLIVYGSEAIQNICNESDLSFTDAAAMAGILITIILIGGVIAILFLSFSGIVDLGKITSNADVTLTDVIKGLLIIGLLFIVIATMALLMGGSYCPAIAG